ncbi:hypothetical protein CEUSTIGMA_g802.t1 [Chlamydomonas eustigma]|uniref:PAS domain-containing protein n=1 Tax=Chlamydomonas eustigma TaxID=1157962 RepID=A0A250WRM4_9CHLO|nr:hypothetical protein CEUSTIGMA_g802.t1 [Chlamydomonas eustigma]|eukprot:GAX73349.1 hypothetical protein CEUSTIGMA_g802.t1 [Chlamydomonas eustigma]
MGQESIAIWVAKSFRARQMEYKWPAFTLRWFGIVTFEMLPMLFLRLLLFAMDCQYFAVAPSALGFNQEFPTQSCWEFPLLINFALAAIGLCLYIFLAATFLMGSMDLNLVSTNLHGLADSKHEVYMFLVKFMLTAAPYFLNGLGWLCVFYLCGSLILLYSIMQWQPYYHTWVNHLKATVYGAFFYLSLLFMFLTYTPELSPGDSDALTIYKRNCTVAMIAGVLPAAGLALYANIIRLRSLDKTIKRFRCAVPGVKSKTIFKFTDPREVEICARCCRQWIDEDTLVEEGVDLALKIIKVGMEQLPGNADMIILYASFLIEVKGGQQSGLTELIAARKADKSVFAKYAIFMCEQQYSKRTAGSRGPGQATDLLSMLENQRSYKLATKANREAFEASSLFWHTLTKSKVKLPELHKRVAALDKAIEESTSLYKQLLQRSPDNWQLIRMYAVFLEMIKNDPWGASRSYEEADRLMQAEEHAQRSAFLTESAMAEGKGGDNSKAVIIINAKCIIQNVNKAACDITGYSQQELIGRNVNMLIPRPFSDQHDEYVLRHVETGKTNILNQDTEFILLHKDRYVLGVNLCVTKVSGFGMDSVFMGVFSAIPTPPDAARAWVMLGGIVLSVDATFADWFGYRPEDLSGAYFSTMVKDSNALERVFESSRVQTSRRSSENRGTNMEGTAAAKTGNFVANLNDFYIKHKFANPVHCSISLQCGGGARSHQFFILTIRCPVHSRQSLMVMDAKGKLLHVNKEVSEDLGYPVVDLLRDMADIVWDVILPEPFTQLHQTHIASELSMVTPPYSCRSGLPVCLMGTSDEGPVPKPYKIKIKTRRLEKLGEATTIVEMEKCTMTQALDERRLTVITDQQGIIIKVGESPAALFGINPKDMVGKAISSYVDVLQCADAAGNEDAARRHCQELLIDLAIRSLEAPGESLRVGVTAPLRIGGDKGSELSGAVAWHMHSTGAHAAVMQIKVHLGDAEESPTDLFEAALMDSKLSEGRSPAPSGRKGMSRRTSVMLVESLVNEGKRLSSLGEVPEEAEDTSGNMRALSSAQRARHMPSSARSPLIPPGRADSPDDLESLASRGLLEQGKGGLVLEVNLWRADMLTGIIHLDKEGTVLRVSEMPMCQPGLIFGVDNDAFIGLHVGSLLDGMKGRKAADLFLPNFGKSLKSKIRGGLKALREGDGGERKLPGAVNILTQQHSVDGDDLTITVQAVRSKGYKKEVCIIFHTLKPAMGHPDLRALLKGVSPGGGFKGLSCRPQGLTGRSESPMDTFQDFHPSPNKGVTISSKSAAIAPRVLVTPSPPSRLQWHDNGEGEAVPAVAGSNRLSKGLSAPVTFSPEPPTLEDLVTELQGEDAEGGLLSGPRFALRGDSDNDSMDEDKLGKAKLAAAKWVLSGGMSTFTNIDGSEDHEGPAAAAATCFNGISAGLPSGGKKIPSGTRVRSPLIKGLGLGPGFGPGGVEENGAGSVRSSEDQGTSGGMSAGNGGGAVGEADFRRGKRYKKISKVMMSQAALRIVDTFRYQVYGAMIFVVAVTVAAFVAMYVQLTAQTLSVSTLNTIGSAGINVGEVFVRAISLSALFEGLGVNSLTNLQGYSSIPTVLNNLATASSSLQSNLYSAFYSILATAKPGSDLINIWETPLLNMTQYADAIPLGVIPTNVNMSLWDAGNLFVAAAETIYQNAYVRNVTKIGNDLWGDWSYVQFIKNNVLTIYNAFFTSMDDLVQNAVDSALVVNQIQFILMLVEGVICSFLASCFIYFLVTKMEGKRHILYSPLLVVPVTVIRNMVKVDLESVVNEVAKPKDGEESTMKLSLGKVSALGQEVNFWDRMKSLFRPLVFWKASVSPSSVYGSKRSFQSSKTHSIIMSLPFAAWGIMIIAIHATGRNQLSQVPEPIALFNIVNFVHMRYLRSFVTATEMVLADSVESTEALRVSLEHDFRLPLEYTAMLYGGAAVPQETSPHYRLATQGAITTGTAGSFILFQTTQCLRLNQSSCLLPNNTLYQDTVNGLDRLIKTHIQTINSMFLMTGQNPTTTGNAFYTVWMLRGDVQGGLIQVNAVYYAYVLNVYNAVLTIQVIGLVMSIVLMMLFYLFLLRPYLKELYRWRKRLAYLYSTLPHEVDVESLVKRAVANSVNGGGASADGTNTNSIALSSSSLAASDKSSDF